MPLDAICLRAVLHELRPQLIGARIDKVQQPARDQIVLLLRGNLRLLLNAGANQPRIQLTNILRDNPAADVLHAAAQALSRRARAVHRAAGS
jgi:predicted ribosome quality control (RQC) complex YloA/Tae2 family protein